VHREAHFTLKLSLDELGNLLGGEGDRYGWPAAPWAGAADAFRREEWTLLQGQIDLLWRSGPQAWTVVDYKSDRVTTEDEIATRTERYAVQMRLYAEAARRLWGARQVRAALYFLQPGRAVEIVS
ncbi:MAG: hypothetical protein GF355_15495, partial [Candidatus Eisenbacteria bacterium]|nr:hypothetical protein [Candidatus Eisenbacteria bacterium]